MTRKAFLLLLSLSTMLVPFTGAFRQVLVHRQEVVTPLRPTISNKIVYLHKHKPTSLWYQADNNENVTNFEAQEEARQRSERINGTGATGKSLLLIVFVFCAWMFTIPPEMRRMNLCDAAETAQNPESCITPGKFANNVADYYRNGGGIKWDFSIGESTRANFDRWAPH